jgi:hypothetical protein
MDFDAGIPMSRSGVGLPAVTEGTSMSPSLSEGSRFLSFLSLCFFLIIIIIVVVVVKKIYIRN